MKIIDEQGRIFGRINVIDFLVLLFFVSLTPMFYFGYKIFNKKPPVSQASQTGNFTGEKEFIQAELKFIFNRVEPKIVGLISLGDKEHDEKNEVIGEIVSLTQAVPFVYEIDTGGAQKMLVEDPLIKQMAVTLRLKAELREGNLYYKDKAVKVNSAIEFDCGKYRLEALYMSSPKMPNEIKKEPDQVRDVLLPSLEIKLQKLASEAQALNERIIKLEQDFKEHTAEDSDNQGKRRR